MKYKNKHTQEIRDVVNVETVENYPENTITYVLDDGDRWERNQFLENWDEL